VLPPGCVDLGDGYWLCEEGAEQLQPAAVGPADPATPTIPDNFGDWINSGDWYNPAIDH